MNYHSQLLGSSILPLINDRANLSGAQKLEQHYKIAQFLKNNRFFYTLSVFLAECSLSKNKNGKYREDDSPDRFAKLIFKIHADLEEKYKNELQDKVKTINETYALEYNRCKQTLMMEMQNHERKLKKLYGNKLDALDERESTQKEDLELKEKEFVLATEEQRRMLVRRFDSLSNKQKNLQLIEQQLKNRIETENEKLNKRQIELENFEQEFQKRVLEFELHKSDKINKIGKEYEQKIKMGSDIEGEVDRKVDRRTENQAIEQKSMIEIKDLAQFIAKLTKPSKLVCEECHCRKKSGSINILENYKAEVEKEISQIQDQLRDIQSRKDFPRKVQSGSNPKKNSHSMVSGEEEYISDFWKKKNENRSRLEAHKNDARTSSTDGNNSESFLPDFVNDAEKRLRNIDNDTKELNEMIGEYVKNQMAQSQAKLAVTNKCFGKKEIPISFEIDAPYSEEIPATKEKHGIKLGTKLPGSGITPHSDVNPSEKVKVRESESIEIGDWESRLELREQQRLQRLKEFDQDGHKITETIGDILATSADEQATILKEKNQPIEKTGEPMIDPLLEQYMKIVTQQKAVDKQSEKPAAEPAATEVQEQQQEIHQKDEAKESSSDFEW